MLTNVEKLIFELEDKVLSVNDGRTYTDEPTDEPTDERTNTVNHRNSFAV